MVRVEVGKAPLCELAKPVSSEAGVVGESTTITGVWWTLVVRREHGLRSWGEKGSHQGCLEQRLWVWGGFRCPTSRATHGIGYGTISGFVWLVLYRMLGQDIGKPLVTDQILAIGGWLFQMGLFRSLDCHGNRHLASWSSDVQTLGWLCGLVPVDEGWSARILFLRMLSARCPFVY